jgi:hypothetical protein
MNLSNTDCATLSALCDRVGTHRVVRFLAERCTYEGPVADHHAARWHALGHALDYAASELEALVGGSPPLSFPRR